MTTTTYTIRQLFPPDVDSYKAMRLEALQTEPGMFGNSYAIEASYPQAQWVDRLANPDGAIFGLFHNQELCGITGIICDKDHLSHAYMTQSYIRYTHRGMGLSRMLYDARLEWSRGHGVQELEIGHRESNLVSKAANQRYGFSFHRRESRTWPDGTTEDMLYYILKL